MKIRCALAGLLLSLLSFSSCDDFNLFESEFSQAALGGLSLASRPIHDLIPNYDPQQDNLQLRAFKILDTSFVSVIYNSRYNSARLFILDAGLKTIRSWYDYELYYDPDGPGGIDPIKPNNTLDIEISGTAYPDSIGGPLVSLSFRTDGGGVTLFVDPLSGWDIVAGLDAHTAWPLSTSIGMAGGIWIENSNAANARPLFQFWDEFPFILANSSQALEYLPPPGSGNPQSWFVVNTEDDSELISDEFDYYVDYSYHRLGFTRNGNPAMALVLMTTTTNGFPTPLPLVMLGTHGTNDRIDTGTLDGLDWSNPIPLQIQEFGMDEVPHQDSLPEFARRIRVSDHGFLVPGKNDIDYLVGFDGRIQKLFTTRKIVDNWRYQRMDRAYLDGANHWYIIDTDTGRIRRMAAWWL